MLSRPEIKQGFIDLITSANNYWAVCAKTGLMTLIVSDLSLKTLTQLEIKFELIDSKSSLPGFPHSVQLTVDQYDLLAEKSDAYSN